MGGTYVAVGHSERRQYNGTTPWSTPKSRRTPAGVTRLCCGEGLETRGRHPRRHGPAQVEAGLPGTSPSSRQERRSRLEPIGASVPVRSPRRRPARRVVRPSHQARRAVQRRRGGGIRVIYGGSVKSGNVAPSWTGGSRGAASVGVGRTRRVRAICRFRATCRRPTRIARADCARPRELSVRLHPTQRRMLVEAVQIGSRYSWYHGLFYPAILLQRARVASVRMFGGGLSSSLGQLSRRAQPRR